MHRVLFRIAAAAVMFLGFAVAYAQLSLTQLKTELVSAWLVTVDGEERTRTLKITGVEQKDSGIFPLEAVYGWTDGNQTPVRAEISQTGQERTLLLTTQPGSKIAATQKSDGNYLGTFTSTSGQTKGLKIEKVSDESLRTKIAAANASRAAGVIVEPGSDVPKECAAFSGRWTGNWPYYGQTWLWVVEVGANCVAKCISWTTSAVPTRFQSCDIKDNVLVRQKSDGAEYYQLRGDELWARYVYSGGQNNAVFRKLKPGEK